jgi:hypothetical protein
MKELMLMSAMTDYELWKQSELRAVAGGSYFNPTTDLAAVGRELIVPEIFGPVQMNFEDRGESTFYGCELFNVLASQLRAREALFGFYIRGHYDLAPLLTDAADLVTYEAQVQEGTLARAGYYSVGYEAADRGLVSRFV